MSGRRKQRRAEAEAQLAAWVPKTEQRLILRQLRRTPEAGRDAALKMAVAVMEAQERSRARYDRESLADHSRRTLVGARLPRSVAARCRTLAAGEGISLYRWIERAISDRIAQEEAQQQPQQPTEVSP